MKEWHFGGWMHGATISVAVAKAMRSENIFVTSGSSLIAPPPRRCTASFSTR
ncbi:hypothetical protein ABIB00_007877 [Bradyrhizobium sp. LB14.3]